MGQKFWTLHCACVLLLGAKASATEVLQIRGAQVQLPFELKVLLKDFDDQELQISGLELKEVEGQGIPGDILRCRNEKASSTFRNSLLLGPDALLLRPKKVWRCEAGGLSQVLLRPLRLEARAGFLSVNSKSYRDAIELIPKENGKLSVVNVLKLEDYLVGVVNKEIRSDFPREAIKAQVVAARSYALATLADRRKNRITLWDLQSNEMDQVYDGSDHEDARSHRFVKETIGEVLMNEGNVLRAYYHSSNGGFSEMPDNVWGDESGALDRGAFAARESNVDREKTPAPWQIQLSPQLGEFIFGVGKIKDVQVISRTSGQRVKQLKIVGEEKSQILTGAEFRRKLGNRWLKSTLFWVSKRSGHFVIEGRGFGHGVGLSQLGARAMARLGKTYKDILKFYYPQAHISKLERIPEKAPIPIEASILPMAR